MGTTLTLLADLYAHVGPGLFLALAFPVLLALFAILLVQGVRRLRAADEELTETA